MLPIREVELDEAPPVMTPIASAMDALLPTAISPKWVAYACRMAGLAKPRWNRDAAVWTTTYIGEGGVTETITIRKSGIKSILVHVEWLTWDGEPKETATARRFVATLITGMQWSLRQQSKTRMSLQMRAS